MKKKVLFMFMASLSAFNLTAQEGQEEPEKYIRPSMTMIRMDYNESDKNTPTEFKGLVKDGYDFFVKNKFPEKYDKNSIGDMEINETYVKNISLDFSKLTSEEQKEYHRLDSLSHRGTTWDTVNIAKLRAYEFQLKYNQALKEKEVAKKIIAQWFNYDGNLKQDGSYFDVSLIQKRGLYAASEVDKMDAEGGTRSAQTILSDKGEVLIGRSFVLLSSFSFYSNEPVARQIRDLAITAANQLPSPANTLGILAANKLYDATKDGYTVSSVSSLYKVKWNDSIKTELYKHWNNKEWFENTDIFELQYVNTQKNTAIVIAGKSNEEIFSKGMDRVMKNVMFKLQKENEEFRPMLTLMKNSPYMVIDGGTKESLQGGESFARVKLIQDSLGHYYYKETPVRVTVDKNYVYNNTLNENVTYVYNSEDIRIDSIKGKKGEVIVKEQHMLQCEEQLDNGEKVYYTLDVEEVTPDSKADAKKLAVISKAMASLGEGYDSSKLLKYINPDDDKDVTYFLKDDSIERWRMAPQVGPDGAVVRGTIVKGTSSNVGALFIQKTFKK